MSSRVSKNTKGWKGSLMGGHLPNIPQALGYILSNTYTGGGGEKQTDRQRQTWSGTATFGLISYSYPSTEVLSYRAQPVLSSRALRSRPRLLALPTTQARAGIQHMGCGCHQRGTGSRHSRLCFLCRLRVTRVS